MPFAQNHRPLLDFKPTPSFAWRWLEFEWGISWDSELAIGWSRVSQVGSHNLEQGRSMYNDSQTWCEGFREGRSNRVGLRHFLLQLSVVRNDFSTICDPVGLRKPNVVRKFGTNYP